MSFLPPVVLEIRAQAAQFFAETAKVAEATKAMAVKTAAATETMSDKVQADVAEMGKTVVAATEAMATKASSRSEVMARRIIVDAEQMDKGTTAAVTAMSKKVTASIEAMSTKSAASMERMSAINTRSMEASAAKIIASQQAIEAKIVELTRVIEAAQAKQVVSHERTAAATHAAGLSMQRTFIETARTAVGTTGAISAAFATAAVTQAEHAARAKRNIMGVADGVTKVAGVTAIALSAIGLHMAAEFEKQTQLLVTAGGESKAQLGIVRQGILDVARDTGTSTEQLAEGMYIMEKAGYRGAEGLAVLRAAAEGAKAENVDLEIMTDALSTTMLDYGYNVSTVTEAQKSAVTVTNQIIAASGAAKTTMRDYVASLAAVVPIASSVGISFVEVGASIATMTQHGQTAQQSSQNLANLIQSLIKPNNLASAAMQQMGLDTVDLAQKLGDVGLSGTLKRVQEAVIEHMGPSGLVVMDTMKKSASASAALRSEIGMMPPELAKMAQGLLDGTTSQLQFQKAAKGTGGEAGAVANQFLNLYKSSQGVNDAMKSGQPAMMTYQAAMTKLLGNVTAARAATMLLMNDSEDLNRSIQLVADAAKEGGQHVHSWADTQALLSTQLDMAQQRVATLAIEIGTKLIPAANGALGGFQDLWDGFEKGDPILMGLAGILGGVVTLSVANFTIKMVQAGIATVTQLGAMGAASITMGQNFIAGFLTAEAAQSSFTGKAGSAGGVVRANLVPALGALGVAAAGAAAYVAVMAANTELYTPKADDMRKAILELAGVVDGKVNMTSMNNQFSRWNEVMGKSTLSVSGVEESVQKLARTDGLSMWLNDLTDGWAKGLGISGSATGQIKDHFKSVGDQLGQLVQGGQTETAAKAFNKLAESFVRNGKSADMALDSMPAYKKSLEDLAAQHEVTLGPTELLELAMGKIPPKLQEAAGASEMYQDAAGNMRMLNEDQKKSLEEMGVAIDGTITDLGKLFDAMVQTGLANLSARDAEFHFGKAVDDAGKKAEELSTKLEGDLSSALNGTGTDFSTTTEAGQAAEEAFSSVARAGLNTAGIMSKDVTKSAEDVTKSMHGTYDQMIETAKKFGLGATEAENLTRKVLDIPDGVSIDSWMADSAKRMAEGTKKAIDDIPKDVKISIEERTKKITEYHEIFGDSGKSASLFEAQNGGKWTGGMVGVPGLAAGGQFSGLVPGRSPSNPRLDNILAMVDGKPLGLRSQEFVINEPQTKANLPWLKAINDGLNMDDMLSSLSPVSAPRLDYAASQSLLDRQAAGTAPQITTNNNQRTITNNVSINSTADAKSLMGEFSRLTADRS